MTDIFIRTEGHAGRITLTRPKALNAVTWDMIRAIDDALEGWAGNDAVTLVIIDAEGDKAFAAGGDIVDLYNTGKAGDFAFGRRFWAEEYRLNARIRTYPKPFVALMHGFVMGGGVGISCHGSHRVVDHSVRIALPECGIGLIPDVGSSWLLARAPEGVGLMAGMTGHRMGPGDALYMGFADHVIPRAAWPALIESLCATGDLSALTEAALPAPEAPLAPLDDVAQAFAQGALPAIKAALDGLGTEAAQTQIKALERQSPLSLVCAERVIRAARDLSFADALGQEYRFVYRCMEHGDFLEGIRAQVIDKDRTPVWRHADASDVTDAEARAMLAPLGDDELTF